VSSRSAGPGERSLLDYYLEVVLPALAARLDQVFPEFGWRRDARGWVATNQETTHRLLGVRADRVVAHGAAPPGFLVHGAEPIAWTAYLNGGSVPRGHEFARVVRELADRAGVDPAPLEQRPPPDRVAELLNDLFLVARRELASARGADARHYLAQRALPPEPPDPGLALMPELASVRARLQQRGYSAAELARAQVLDDPRWAGRIIGAWRDESGRIGTLWARATSTVDTAKYLYLRGRSRSDLPPYGLTDVLGLAPNERRQLLLVEGVLDAHQLRARGLHNVAALGGTTIAAPTFDRLTRCGIEQVVLLLDNDQAGRQATARAIDRATQAIDPPQLDVLDPALLAPAKDADAYIRQHDADALRSLLKQRSCAISWRALQLLHSTDQSAPAHQRRAALARAGHWLGTLPPRLALEQEDALRLIANRCGYSTTAVERAFRARFYPHHPTSRPPRPQPQHREPEELER
jgi:DNA primase